MEIKIFQIDAFADKLFAGNPAAVCPLDGWLPDGVMQDIARENNLSETAFFVPKDGGYHLRWFTPTNEVDLCGHATLATAYVLFHHLGHSGNAIRFDSKSGALPVTRRGEFIELDFPDRKPETCDAPDALLKAFDLKSAACLKRDDYILVFENEKAVREANAELAPYWAQKLGKKELRARQLSQRGGEILCRVENGRVFLAGKAVFYMEGRIRIP